MFREFWVMYSDSIMQTLSLESITYNQPYYIKILDVNICVSINRVAFFFWGHAAAPWARFAYFQILVLYINLFELFLEVKRQFKSIDFKWLSFSCIWNPLILRVYLEEVWFCIFYRFVEPYNPNLVLKK